MNIHVLDDYQDTIRTLGAYAKVAGHQVTIWRDHTKDVAALAARLRDAEVICLLRERTPVRAALIERLDRLRLISQVGVYPHIDVEACTRRGVIVAASQMPGRPSYATAELNWGLILAAFRRIPQEMILMRAGSWQGASIGVGVRGKTLGIYGYGKIGGVVAGYGDGSLFNQTRVVPRRSNWPSNISDNPLGPPRPCTIGIRRIANGPFA